MSLARWFALPRVRRSLAISTILLAAGGLVLLRAPAAAKPNVVVGQAAGNNKTSFSGPGVHGALALSHSRVLAGGERRIYAELRLAADAVANEGKERAPLSLAVVLDTSGSMQGDKIERAKSAVAQLVRGMRDDDEIAFVRYASDVSIVQPLARLGSVRSALERNIADITANGGTDIPLGLSRGLAALSEATRGRVKRVVLVSDGLDSSRADAERLARDSAGDGLTISTLGIGLDFDEAYLGSVARSGHGNFAFDKDGDALASFLDKELRETAKTTVDNASARIRLPSQMRFVRAVGATAKPLEGGEIELGLGSVFGGDERRVVIELAANLESGEQAELDSDVTWTRVGGDATRARLSALHLGTATSEREVDEGRDPTVFASATSAFASLRQVEANEAYAKGDAARGDALLDQNVADLQAAAVAAPAPAATHLAAQESAYRELKKARTSRAPGEGNAATKRLLSTDVDNLNRAGF